MFTGLISDVGRIGAVDGNDGGLHARVVTSYEMAEVPIGASIACDGVCLTVSAKGRDWFEVDVSAETLSLSNLAGWCEGKSVNLERSLRLGDEMGGHIVSGHVDGVAELISLRPEGTSTRLSLRAPEHLARFIARKGSVALNGASLTVNEVERGEFGVNLIPHTMAVTNWGHAAVGDWVNLEVDTLARYVARLQDVPG